MCAERCVNQLPEIAHLLAPLLSGSSKKKKLLACRMSLFSNRKKWPLCKNKVFLRFCKRQYRSFCNIYKDATSPHYRFLLHQTWNLYQPTSRSVPTFASLPNVSPPYSEQGRPHGLRAPRRHQRDAAGHATYGRRRRPQCPPPSLFNLCVSRSPPLSLSPPHRDASRPVDPDQRSASPRLRRRRHDSPATATGLRDLSPPPAGPASPPAGGPVLCRHRPASAQPGTPCAYGRVFVIQ